MMRPRPSCVLKSLVNEDYEKRKISSIEPGFLEKTSKQIEASKTLDKLPEIGKNELRKIPSEHHKNRETL